MDVRCERCRAQYVFDDEQVTPAGLTVQCTNCGHVFRVKKKELVVTVAVKADELEGTPFPANAVPARAAAGAAPAPEPRAPVREWKLRRTTGQQVAFRELTTLQKWVVERKVGLDDEISQQPGGRWRRLGDIAELASFFRVVEDANRGRALTPPTFAPAPPEGALPPPPSLETPLQDDAAPPPPEESFDVDLGTDPGAEALARRRGGRGWRVAGAVVLAVAAAGVIAYALVPDLFRPRRPALPPVVAGPPLEIKAPPAEPPPPAPAPAEPPAAAPAQGEAGGAKPAARKSAAALLAEAARLREKGEIEKALDIYGALVDEEPDNVDALAGRGLCYLDLERYPPAEASFQAALEVDPRQADALLGLAEAYRWQGKKADAIRYYERYLAAHPGGEDAEVARNALEELRK
jgi:predicted Zn finger-like uncharacterized protein